MGRDAVDFKRFGIPNNKPKGYKFSTSFRKNRGNAEIGMQIKIEQPIRNTSNMPGC